MSFLVLLPLSGGAQTLVSELTRALLRACKSILCHNQIENIKIFDDGSPSILRYLMMRILSLICMIVVS